MDDVGYVHIVGCVDARDAADAIDGRTVEYGRVRETVSAALTSVGSHLGGEWHCVKFRVSNNDAGDAAAYHRDAVAQVARPCSAGYTVAVYVDDAYVDVVPGSHAKTGVRCALSLASRVRLRVRAGDVVVRSTTLIAREVLTKHAASRRAIHMYGCYPSRRELERCAPRTAHATTRGRPVLNGAVLFMCALMPRAMSILSGLAFLNAALGYGTIANSGASYVASEGFQPRADVGEGRGPTNVFVVVGRAGRAGRAGDADELGDEHAAEFTWVAYTRQAAILALVITFLLAVFIRVAWR
jgi:hypothetical protein